MESASEISRDLALKAEAFCRAYFPNGRRAGNFWQVGDVSGAEGGSLAIRLKDSNGRKAGKWTDYNTGEHGDLLDLIPHATRATTFVEVMDEARSFLNKPEIRRIEKTPSAPVEKSSAGPVRAKRLFAIGRPILGTPLETYLRARGITRFGDALAYHPAVYFREADSSETRQLPAMLGKITDASDRLTGVSRTWLDIERSIVADILEPKRVIGDLLGNAVRFGKPGEVLAAGEGIETMLSIGSALTELPLAACLTATHLGLFDVPEGVRELWIVKDKDEAGERAAGILHERLAGRDIIIRDLEPVLADFNEDLCEWGVRSLRERLLGKCGATAARFVGRAA